MYETVEFDPLTTPLMQGNQSPDAPDLPTFAQQNRRYGLGSSEAANKIVWDHAHEHGVSMYEYVMEVVENERQNLQAAIKDFKTKAEGYGFFRAFPYSKVVTNQHLLALQQASDELDKFSKQLGNRLKNGKPVTEFDLKKDVLDFVYRQYPVNRESDMQRWNQRQLWDTVCYNLNTALGLMPEEHLPLRTLSQEPADDLHLAYPVVGAENVLRLTHLIYSARKELWYQNVLQARGDVVAVTQASPSTTAETDSDGESPGFGK